MQTFNNKLIKKDRFWLIFVIFLTSFLLGFIFSLKIGNYFETDLLKNYYNLPIIVDEKEELNLSKLRNVYSIIKNNYFDADEIKKEDLIDEAISGLVKGLGDKHSEYFNPKGNQMFISSLSGDFEGIGAVVSTVPLGVKVESSIKGSPAKLNDVRIGDIIISANGTSLKGLTVSEAVDYIKGPSGTSVTLEIVRDGESGILMKELIRDAIKIPSVDYEKFEDYGYISINMFGDNTSNEFKEVLNNLTNTKGIVIDLRDNGGGYLLSATEILSNLVQRGEKLVITKYKGNSRPDEYYKSINNGSIYNGKIVVLINEISASASEIVAGALKDLGLAILVGKKSYGKGSVQQPFQLTDGSMVKLTTAKWFTPLGTNIDEEGITPDIEINFINEDYENLYDRQKEEAKKILKKFVKIGNIEKVISDFAIEIP